MKKLTATILGLFSLVVCANAQGTFVIDSSANAGNGSGPTATSGGLVWLDPDGVLSDATLDTSVDINLSMEWGLSANSVNNMLNLDPLGLNTGIYAGSKSWIASQPTGMQDITYYADGALLDPNGNAYVVPGAAAGTTIWVQLFGWTGNSPTHANGTLKGFTAPFTVTVEIGTAPIEPDVRNMSALVLSAPEPSLPALSALGAAAFALIRRRK